MQLTEEEKRALLAACKAHEHHLECMLDYHDSPNSYMFWKNSLKTLRKVEKKVAKLEVVDP